LTHREYIINIVYEELVKLLGAEPGKFEIKEKPTRILLVGLFGSGKTTTAAKLAKLFKKQGQKVCLVQTDTWRPAAYEQLKQLSEKINVPFYGIKDEKDPVKIVQKFEPDYGRFNVVIFDSAGRDALSAELTTEIKKLNQAVKPHEKLLVMSGDIGQAAKAQAKAFKENIGVTGVIITKLDGTAKGGGAISACAETGARVKFIGIGEHIDDFEDYEPKRFVSRLLGLGDLQTLLQKAEEAMKKEDAEALAKKFIKAEFTFDDLMKQMEALQKMGPLSQIMSMIPGASMAKIPPELMQVQEGKLKTWKFIIQSMTKQERDNPDLIEGSRIRRIAKGSGKPESEVRDLVKQYNQMKKMMKMMGNQKQMQKLQKMLGGKMPMGL
jgi:signal recognition particle subunit SRP54